jgi:hypothetical protein
MLYTGRSRGSLVPLVILAALALWAARGAL